jgi:hypothetical protein
VQCRHHLGLASRHDGGFGACGVVLVQFGDGVEQARSQRVVEELGRHVRGRRQQAGGGLGSQRLSVHFVQLDEAGFAHAGDSRWRMDQGAGM